LEIYKMASALDQYDPDNLLNVIKELEGRIQALEQGYVSANSADELVSDGGDLGDYTGNTVIPASDSDITDVSDPDFTGLFMSAEGVDIDGVVYSMGSLTIGVLQWGVVKDEPIIVVGDHAVELSDAGITAVAGLIGGWEIVTDVLQKLSADVGISLNATDRIIKVGNTAGNHIQIDGANERIRSSNFVTGKTGMNIDAATGDAEFNNLVARGELRTFLLTAENQMAVSGQIMISKDAGKIAAAVSSGATTVNFGKTLVVGDWVKFHGTDADGNNSIEWMLIGTLVSGTTYNVTRNIDGTGANSWAEDTAFAVIGQSGDSRIELVAGASGTIQLITQGATWNTQTIQAEMSTVDGAIVAGAGGVTLNSDGISLNDDVGEGKVYFRRGGIIIGQIDSSEPSAGLSKLTISQGRTAAGITGEVEIYANTNTAGDGNPNKLYLGLTTEINKAKEDLDTKIFGTNTAPVVVIDAGTNSMAVSGGFFGLGAPTTLTIDAAGAITATKSNHYVDTFGAAATDDLTTINGGAEGDILVIGTANSARDVTVKDGTGNLRLAGGDFTLSNTDDQLMLKKIAGSVWVELGRNDNS